MEDDLSVKRYLLRIPVDIWERLVNCKKKLANKTSIHMLILQGIIFYLVELEKKLGIATKEEHQ